MQYATVAPPLAAACFLLPHTEAKLEGERARCCRLGSAPTAASATAAAAVTPVAVWCCRQVQNRCCCPHNAAEGGNVVDALEFLLVNFTEMNKLWVRMAHQVRQRVQYCMCVRASCCDWEKVRKLWVRIAHQVRERRPASRGWSGLVGQSSGRCASCSRTWPTRRAAAAGMGGSLGCREC